MFKLVFENYSNSKTDFQCPGSDGIAFGLKLTKIVAADSSVTVPDPDETIQGGTSVPA